MSNMAVLTILCTKGGLSAKMHKLNQIAPFLLKLQISKLKSDLHDTLVHDMLVQKNDVIILRPKPNLTASHLCIGTPGARALDEVSV